LVNVLELERTVTENEIEAMDTNSSAAPSFREPQKEISKQIKLG